MALKLARVAGCKVVITSSSDAKLEKIRQMDGTHSIDTINYVANPDWDQEAIRINEGVGVDIVIENGGMPTIVKSINAAGKRGIISVIGYLGQQDPEQLRNLLSILIDKTVTIRHVSRPWKFIEVLMSLQWDQCRLPSGI